MHFHSPDAVGPRRKRATTQTSRHAGHTTSAISEWKSNLDKSARLVGMEIHEAKKYLKTPERA
jgi:hypothetical protein